MSVIQRLRAARLAPRGPAARRWPQRTSAGTSLAAQAARAAPRLAAPATRLLGFTTRRAARAARAARLDQQHRGTVAPAPRAAESPPSGIFARSIIISSPEVPSSTAARPARAGVAGPGPAGYPARAVAGAARAAGWLRSGLITSSTSPAASMSTPASPRMVETPAMRIAAGAGVAGVAAAA